MRFLENNLNEELAEGFAGRQFHSLKYFLAGCLTGSSP